MRVGGGCIAHNRTIAAALTILRQRSAAGSVRVARITCGVVSAYPIRISRAGRQTSIGIAVNICRYGGDLRKVTARGTGAAFNQESAFIIGIVSPQEVYLTCGNRSCSEITGGGRYVYWRWQCSSTPNYLRSCKRVPYKNKPCWQTDQYWNSC